MNTKTKTQDSFDEELPKIPYYIPEARLAYTIKQLTGILHIRADSLYKKYINTGLLPSKKVGGSRLVEHSNLMKFLKESC